MKIITNDDTFFQDVPYKNELAIISGEILSVGHNFQIVSQSRGQTPGGKLRNLALILTPVFSRRTAKLKGSRVCSYYVSLPGKRQVVCITSKTN